MDLDKLIASLQDASRTSMSDAPLFVIDQFVPLASDDPAADENAARRMMAAFTYWLVKSGKLAPSAVSERTAAMLSIRKSESDQIGAIVAQHLDDKLLPSDVQTEWRAFASSYLAPVEGGLGDDYFRMFVESRGGLSIRDVTPTRSDYEEIASLIESRAKRFLQKAPDWNEPLGVVGLALPAIWKGGSKEAWLEKLVTYHDLMESPPGLLRSRIAEYWSLVDAAVGFAGADVAAALAKTYLWVDDASIQQSVYRALTGFPPMDALQGILANIVILEAETNWGDTVVDVFPDNLDKEMLLQLAKRIEAAPLEQHAAYLRALARAQRNGSSHAARLLEVLDEH